MMELPHDASSSDYGDPIRRLLTLGETPLSDPAKWPDYVAEFGLGSGHVGELVRMACDTELHWSDGEGCLIWAPVHAWRALAQLRAAAAVTPLLAYLRVADEDDWAEGELPVVFGMIGPAAIAPTAAFLAGRSNPPDAAIAALSGLKEIADRHPECRGDCVGIVTRVLERAPGKDRLVNGYAVSTLLDLHAVESIDAIRAAFRRKVVDLSIAGDEEDVEIDLGLRIARVTPVPYYPALPSGLPAPPVRHDKVGRNDPCPCGSGKKYKKCCLP